MNTQGTKRASNGFWDFVEGRRPLCPASQLLGLKFLSVDAEAGTVETEFKAIEQFVNPAGQFTGGHHRDARRYHVVRWNGLSQWHPRITDIGNQDFVHAPGICRPPVRNGKAASPGSRFCFPGRIFARRERQTHCDSDSISTHYCLRGIESASH
jgi:hypothetical protein